MQRLSCGRTYPTISLNHDGSTPTMNPVLSHWPSWLLRTDSVASFFRLKLGTGNPGGGRNCSMPTSWCRYDMGTVVAAGGFAIDGGVVFHFVSLFVRALSFEDEEFGEGVGVGIVVAAEFVVLNSSRAYE